MNTADNTVTLHETQIDDIVVNELKDSINLQFDLDKDEGGEYLEPDYQLIDAIKTVLAYYMPQSEYEKYMREVAFQELTVQAQLDNQYVKSS